ncbi:MAG: lysophospholipid acyltransferase family protein [Myxococcota bacterium]
MWRRVTSPVFFGLENVPREGPAMLVGNHTLYGVLDVPFLMLELWERHGIRLVGLGDHQHFRVPLWRDFLAAFGAVDGTPENASRLLDAGAHLLVFPGGAWEVFKRKGQAYQLSWRKRTGFARLALRHGVPVVPVSAVGADETWRILLDADELLATPPGRVLRRLGLREDLVPPISRGLGPTLLPRPERYYFRAGEPIVPAPGESPEALRARVEAAVIAGIDALLLHRESDPGRYPWGRARGA